ncbi:MAG TPA: hypothetical protein VD963_00110 [Phycisphaerales bacterium]|nr:hypothetical protein [Phycisphaerales bacterium]
MVSLRVTGADEEAGGPAVLIVAGLDGRHQIGPAVARRVAQQLAERHGTELTGVRVYVAPALNTSGLRASLAGPLRGLQAFTTAPDDADGDGRQDEDGPADVDGDGVITMLRVADAPGGLGLWGLARTHVIDAEDPRLMREPDAGKGEVATHALLVEGHDRDGDGLIAEDGPGGIDLNKAFPYRWPEATPGAGARPLADENALELVRWLLGHEEVRAVVVYGPWDNLVNAPQAGRMDSTGRVPIGIEEADRAAHEQVATAFKEITRMTGAPAAGDPAGMLHGWAYANHGLWSFVTPVWVRPDQVKKVEAAPGGASEPAVGEAGGSAGVGAAPPTGEAPAVPGSPPPGGTPPGGAGPGGGGAGPGAAPGGGAGGGRGAGRRSGRGGGGGPARPVQAAPSTGEDAAWLKYADEVGAVPGGERVFVPWRRFEHPQLGEVEIGGFVPGFKVDGPEEAVERLADEQVRFVLELVRRLGRLELQAEAEPVGGAGSGLWRVTARLRNTGSLPTRSAMAVKAGRPGPTLLTLGSGLETVLVGEPMRRIEAVAPGGEVVAEWLVRGEEGTELDVSVKEPGEEPRVRRVRLGGPPERPEGGAREGAGREGGGR